VKTEVCWSERVAEEGGFFEVWREMCKVSVQIFTDFIDIEENYKPNFKGKSL